MVTTFVKRSSFFDTVRMRIGWWKSTKVGIACLPDAKETFEGAELTVLGWGMTARFEGSQAEGITSYSLWEYILIAVYTRVNYF